MADEHNHIEGDGPNAGLVSFSETQADDLIRLYDEAEKEIIAAISTAMMRGNDVRYLQKMLANVNTILDDLLHDSQTWSETAIPNVYIKAYDAVDKAMNAAGIKTAPHHDAAEKVAKGAQVGVAFGNIHQQAAQVLAENTFQRLEDVTAFIGRRVNDIYRTVSLDSVRGSTIGYETWKQAADNVKNNLAEKGITGFQDAAGRNWNMSTYAQMVARTTTMEAHLQGTANRIVEYGRDLVMVSHHAHPCNRCQPWEGKVLSLTGKDMEHADGTLADAQGAGLFHPNCRHAYGLYIAGLSD